MNVLLWVLQGVMAFITVPSGVMAALGLGLTPDPSPVRRLGGALSAACGTALVVPGLIGTATILTPIAALALVLPAAGFPALRLRQGEIGPVFWFFGTLYLAAAPLLVAWGRLGPYPL